MKCPFCGHMEDRVMIPADGRRKRDQKKKRMHKMQFPFYDV